MNKPLTILKTWRKTSKAASVRYVRMSGLFDDEWYRAQLKNAEDISDLVEHYVSIGEKIGLSPNKDFDPHFYALKNPDVTASRWNLFVHFLCFGRREGRIGRTPATELATFTSTSSNKKVILLAIHEMSRTGAPILGWNIAIQLRELGYRVVTVSLNGGELRSYFDEISDIVISLEGITRDKHKEKIEEIISAIKPEYAICNSIVTASLSVIIENFRVPVVNLVHEFFSYAKDVPDAEKALLTCSALVFPADIVRDSACEYISAVKLRPTYIIPQGKSLVPRKLGQTKASEFLVKQKKNSDFIVLGAGTIEWRKGVDLFISTSSLLSRIAPELKFKFLWVGNCTHDKAYYDYLKEQIQRSGGNCSVEFLGGTEHLETVYQNVDALFMSSRLDPLPNVTIDAACAGLPVVCFKNASGFAELLERNEDCKELVAPYVDTSAAANILLKLAKQTTWRKTLEGAIKSFAFETFNMRAYVLSLDRIGQTLKASEADRISL